MKIQNKPDNIDSIPGFSGYYITREGVVFSNRRNYWGKLSPNREKKGYLNVVLSCEDRKPFKFRCMKIHRLVCLTYLPNPNNYPQINHKNGIKDDNRLENLEWCDQSWNQKHAFRLGLNKPNYSTLGKRGALCHMSKPVFQTSLDGFLISEFSCSEEAGRVTGLDPSSISKCARGLLNTCGGYKWIR